MLQNVELRTLLGKVGKGIVVVASSYAYQQRRKGDASHGGQFVNTHSTDMWDIEKRPAVHFT